MLGHASAAMTLDVYADLFEDDLDAVAARLDVGPSATDVGKMWPTRRALGRPRGKLPPDQHFPSAERGKRVGPVGLDPPPPLHAPLHGARSLRRAGPHHKWVRAQHEA